MNDPKSLCLLCVRKKITEYQQNLEGVFMQTVINTFREAFRALVNI